VCARARHTQADVIIIRSPRDAKT